MKKFFHIVGALAATILLSGCLEGGGAICFRPGVYQGAADPLIGKVDTDALTKRFGGQIDR